MGRKRTMSELSYGISEPRHLLDKLLFDAQKITDSPHPYDTFNFMVTAAVLSEWIRQYYPDHPTVQQLKKAIEKDDWTQLPNETEAWFHNLDCFPNKGADCRRHVWNASRICWHTANASKHFHWNRESQKLSAIEDSPKIKNWYQYYYTSRGPGIFVEYAGEYYSLTQIRDIVTQFYEGFFSHIDAAPSVASMAAPEM